VLSAAADLCAGDVVMHDLAADDCLCLLLDPGDLCDCGFSDPVASLLTTPNSRGVPLVQLPVCRVTLPRLPSLSSLLSTRSSRLTRSQVLVLVLWILTLDLPNLQVPVIYGPDSGSDYEVGVLLPFCFQSQLPNFQAPDLDSGSGESGMTHLSGMESKSDFSEVPL
jgi:hypothetical protein